MMDHREVQLGREVISARRVSAFASLRLVLLALLLAATCAGLFAPVARAGALSTESFSDSLPLTPMTHSQEATLKRQQCLHTPAKGSLGFTAGLKQAQSSLSQFASTSALHKLAASKDTRNPRTARVTAAAAMLDQRPAAALAALLDAQRHSPHDAMTLIDMASVLDEMELPKEALAVLSGVRSVKGLPTPMGISMEATLQDARGMALLRLGRNTQAVVAFKAAIKASPGLTAAAMNLAVSQLCAGGNPTFPGWADPPPPSEPPETTSGVQTQQAGSTFDMSGGVTGMLPTVPYPTDYQQVEATEDNYHSLYNEFSSQVDSDATQSAQRTQQYESTNPSTLTDHRTGEIMQLIEDQNEWPPALQALANAANDPPSAVDAAGIPDDFQSDLAAAGNSCSDETCYDAACKAAAVARTTQWHTDMVQWDTAERNFFAAYYQYATALASNLSIPASYQQALLQARSIGDAIIGSAQGLPNTAWMWADMLNSNDSCLNPATTADGTSNGSTPSSASCSPSLKAMKATLDLEFMTVAVECEKFTIEISTPGPIGLFAEASFNTKSGQTTIFAGGKAGAEIPGGFGTSSKTGLYLTTGSDGSVVDVGGRFGTGASTGGPVSLNASDSMDFSFMPSATGGSLFDSE